MSNETQALITTHTHPHYGIRSGESGGGENSRLYSTGDEQKNIEEDQCKSTCKILAFATFLMALSIGGYFTADLLANKGESIKLITPFKRHKSNKKYTTDILYDSDISDAEFDITQDIRAHNYLEPFIPPSGNGNGNQNQQSPIQKPLPVMTDPKDSGKGHQNMDNGDFSMMKVTNCDKTSDVSTDSETYMTDIRAVANYLKTYWNSYEALVNSEVQQLSNGEALDPTCLMEKFEEGEVVCVDIQCVYDGECVWRTNWGAVEICKYIYFDIGALRNEARADRRACIASTLVEQWSDSCWKHDHIAQEMKSATFKWWKQIFTVSDEWELDNCPC